MPDLFTTNAMLGVIEGLKVPVPALVERYFGTTAQDESEEIHFDVLKGKRRIAPFVSPLVEGQLVESLGFEAKTFKPAYIKDKRRWAPNQPFKRTAGEAIGGSLTPQQRMDAYLAAQLTDQINMVRRRLEVMASEILRTGKVTVEGTKYPKQVVDFGRTAALTPTALASTARWGQSAEDPLGNLQTWADLVLKESGTTPQDVIMGVDAWTKFRANTEVKARLNTLNVVGNQIQTGAQLVEGLTRRGNIDGFEIYTYGGWYVDPVTGTESPIWPTDVVGMTSSLLEGVQFYGAIQDPRAGLRAVPYFPKMWIDEDPAVTWLMLQSAPLLVPQRVNASLAVDVL